MCPLLWVSQIFRVHCYGYSIITYALNQEEKAMRLFEDGRLELDNNMAERTVKPYVINRKNSLFNFTERGAKASCILFGICASLETLT